MSDLEKLAKIAAVLPEVMNTSANVRVRRGRLHGTICRILRIPRSNHHVKLIKSVLTACGVRAVTIRGRSFYVTYPCGGKAKVGQSQTNQSHRRTY